MVHRYQVVEKEEGGWLNMGVSFDRWTPAVLKQGFDVRQKLEAEDVRNILLAAEAFWRHNGDLAMPHAQLHSGKCSNGFVDVMKALKYSSVCLSFAKNLAAKISSYLAGLDLRLPDGVVGSDHAAAKLSAAISFEFNAWNDFCEKIYQADGSTSQIWKRFIVGEQELVLRVEDLITTAKTVNEVTRAIELAHPYPIKFMWIVGTVVDRTDPGLELKFKPVSLLRIPDIKTWEPAECPLCAGGSPRITPKGTENWRYLITGQK